MSNVACQLQMKKFTVLRSGTVLSIYVGAIGAQLLFKAKG